jgi:alanine racemase/UDP-N-acetylmuramoyl-tripeptide--D-alanyl-D-alanine ligase
MAVLKANAYGTDLGILLQVIQKAGIQQIAVAHIREALSLRKLGFDGQVLVLNPEPIAYDAALHNKLDLSIYNREQLRCLARRAELAQTPARLHLSLDTGMGRWACAFKELPQCLHEIAASAHLCLEGLMSHASAAEDPELDNFTRTQYQDFLAGVDLVHTRGFRPPWLHFSNSAHLLRFGSPECTSARVGLALYGVYPSQACQTLPLELCLELKTSLHLLGPFPKGWPIGYGATFRTPEANYPLGFIPLGYHDGLWRSHSGAGSVRIAGQQAPLVGAVSMDSAVVDLSSIGPVQDGQEVTLFGPELRPEHVAEEVGRIPHDLITCLGPRIQRCARSIERPAQSSYRDGQSCAQATRQP